MENVARGQNMGRNVTKTTKYNDLGTEPRVWAVFTEPKGNNCVVKYVQVSFMMLLLTVNVSFAEFI